MVERAATATVNALSASAATAATAAKDAAVATVVNAVRIVVTAARTATATAIVIAGAVTPVSVFNVVAFAVGRGCSLKKVRRVPMLQIIYLVHRQVYCHRALGTGLSQLLIATMGGTYSQHQPPANRNATPWVSCTARTCPQAHRPTYRQFARSEFSKGQDTKAWDKSRRGLNSGDGHTRSGLRILSLG
jgi:hypothetical protein